MMHNSDSAPRGRRAHVWVVLERKDAEWLARQVGDHSMTVTAKDGSTVRLSVFDEGALA